MDSVQDTPLTKLKYIYKLDTCFPLSKAVGVEPGGRWCMAVSSEASGCETAASVSPVSRLNSSKQPQAPLRAKPVSSRPMHSASIP